MFDIIGFRAEENFLVLGGHKKQIRTDIWLGKDL